jgi:hypothetical protein
MKKSFDNFLYDIFSSKKKTEVVNKKDDLPNNIRNLINKIDLQLKGNDIPYEIPFVYKKNNSFQTLKIIVSNLYTPQQLSEILNIDEYKSEKEFVDTVIDGVKVTLILTPEDKFPLTFWYYSWDILPTLLNVLFEGFGLLFDKDGLKYTPRNNFLLSTKIDEIIEFLGLDFNQYKAGFFTLENEIDYIMNSPSFNADLFFNYKLNEKDHFFNENLQLFNKSLEIYEPFRETSGNFVFSNDKDVYLSFIAEYFYDSGLIEKLTGQKK